MQQEKKISLKLPGKRIRNKQYKCGQQMLQANHNTSEWLYSGYVQYKSKPRVLYHNYRIMYLFAQLRKRMHFHALNGDLLWINPWAMCK